MLRDDRLTLPFVLRFAAIAAVNAYWPTLFSYVHTCMANLLFIDRNINYISLLSALGCPTVSAPRAIRPPLPSPVRGDAGPAATLAVCRRTARAA